MPKEVGMPPVKPSLQWPPIQMSVITKDPVPAFKNNKRSILDKNTGLQRTLTKKEVKKRMDLITRSLVSTLLSDYLTTGNGTSTACVQLSSIVSRLPAKDSLQWVPRILLDYRQVEKGQEGFEITIQQISEPLPPWSSPPDCGSSEQS